MATGIAAVPLLFAKLWSVFPRLFTWPPARDVLHALERLSLLPLVGGAVFMLVTGVANIDLWYPWPFYFPAAHYAVAWITIGALVVHIGAKASITRRALRRAEVPPADDVRGRRRFLGLAIGSSVGLVVITAGQIVLTAAAPGAAGAAARRHRRAGLPGEPHRRRSGRRAGGHVAGLPAARRAGRRRAAATSRLAELAALPQRSATLPISCVEGWSASVRWTGVPLRAVIDAAGVAERDRRRGGVARGTQPVPVVVR